MFFPSKREIATPRGLGHRARLGVRNDPPILYFLGLIGESPSLPRQYKSVTQSPVLVVQMLVTKTYKTGAKRGG